MSCGCRAAGGRSAEGGAQVRWQLGEQQPGGGQHRGERGAALQDLDEAGDTGRCRVPTLTQSGLGWWWSQLCELCCCLCCVSAPCQNMEYLMSSANTWSRPPPCPGPWTRAAPPWTCSPSTTRPSPGTRDTPSWSRTPPTGRWWSSRCRPGTRASTSAPSRLSPSSPWWSTSKSMVS